MNENEDYYRFHKRGDLHVLSTRIPFKGSDLIIAPLSVGIPLMAFLGWFQGIIAGLLTFVVYGGYRYAASLHYHELHIDSASGNVRWVKMKKNNVIESVAIDDQFEISKIIFEEMTRSGSTKYLLRYRTHKDHDLLVLKTAKDRDAITDYLRHNLDAKHH